MLPFTMPGWNTLYAAANPGRGGLPVGRGIFPYLRDRLYAPEFSEAIRAVDPYADTDRLLAEGRELDPVSRYQYYDTLQYLPADILVKVDRMSMANSLEVRAPMLDHLLVEYAARLPVGYKLRDGVSKRILRRIAAKILPPEILEKRKQGFAIPKGEWLRRELRGAAESILLDARTVRRGYFRRPVLERILRAHATGRRDYSDWIWCLIVLEMWHRAFVDAAPSSAPSGVA
jgi:asparagine synthase (glutamine-hydrolysing)